MLWALVFELVWIIGPGAYALKLTAGALQGLHAFQHGGHVGG